MKHDSRRALEQDVKGEFHLPLLKLHGASGWDVYLGTALAGGALALLVLHPAEGGKRELDVVRSLRADNGVGVTRCPRCAAVAPGWPRFCAGCAHDLRNVPGSADTVREVLEQQWPGSRLLGSIPDSEGGGAMYLVRGGRRGLRTGFVTGMVIDRDEAGAPVVVPCWAMDQATLERCRQTPARAAVRPVGVGSANRPPENTPPAGPREVEAKERRPLGRRELRWAAAALLLLLSGVLAFNPSLRGRDTQPTVPPRSDSVISALTTPPDTTIVAPPPVDSAPPLAAAPTGKRRPAPKRDSVVAPDTVVLPVPAPDPELDRRQVLSLARNFATAFGTQDIDRVRAAYAGMSAEEERGWVRWFANGHDLRVRFVLDHGPVVVRDSATAGFTLGLRFARQRSCMVFDATMVRSGDGWILQRLNAGAPNPQACREIHRGWEGVTPDP